MYWTWFEWIDRIGGLIQLLLTLGVGLCALAVATQLTRRRQYPQAAWLLALGWLVMGALDLALLFSNWILAPVLGYSPGQWLSYAVNLLCLLALCIMAAGLFGFHQPGGGRS